MGDDLLQPSQVPLDVFDAARHPEPDVYKSTLYKIKPDVDQHCIVYKSKNVRFRQGSIYQTSYFVVLYALGVLIENETLSEIC